MTHLSPRLNRPTTRAQRDARRACAVLAAGAVLIGIISLGESVFKNKPSQATAAAPNSQAASSAGAADVSSTTVASAIPGGVDAPSTTVATAQLTQDGLDVTGDEPTAGPSACKIDKRELRIGDAGDAVTCLQQALIANAYLSGAPSGQYDNATFAAVEQLQKEKDLFVDGLVGRETGLALNVWPDEASLVVHTPAPAPGAVDLLGYPLSQVAANGPDAPQLPANSGSGKRVVYDRTGQRVWAVDKNERVIRSWLVAGSKYNNEVPGTHKVFSRSEVSTAWNGKAFLPKMIRWLKTDIGNIGFHGIPRHVADGSRYMKDSELGQRLSGGCQRQADADAAFMWDFAQVGTAVVVL